MMMKIVQSPLALNELLARRSVLPRRFLPAVNAAEQKASNFVLVLCANKPVQSLT
jgi:hypothetical protein